MRTREKCGCAHDGHKWLALCDEHRAEFNDTHERWAVEHAERQPSESACEVHDRLVAEGVQVDKLLGAAS